MKFTKLFIAVAIVMAAFASCKKSSQDLTNVIPADASYVMYVDMQSLISKSDYDIFENVTVSRGINMAKALFSKKEAADMLEAFSKNANSLGVDLKGDVFVYTDYTYYGLIAAVNDAEKIKNALVNFSVAAEDEVTLENGIYTYSPDEAFAVCWNSDKILILFEYDNYSYYEEETEEDVDLVALAKKQLTQGSGESINTHAAFADFIDNKKDISIFSVFSEKYFSILTYLFGYMELPEEIGNELNDLKGMSGTMHVSFEKGEVKSESKANYPNADVRKKYEQLLTQVCGKLNGEQLKYIPENPVFAISFSLNGPGFYNYLERLNVTSKIDEMDEEGLFKTVLNEINGDITFALSSVKSTTKTYEWGDGSSYEYESTMPEYVVMIAANDGPKMLELAKGNIFDFEKNIAQIDDDSYVTDVDGDNLYFGNSDNTLYITNIEEVSGNIKSKSGKGENYSSLAKGNAAIVAGNIKSLKPIVAEQVDDKTIRVMANELIDMFESYSLVTPRDANGITTGKIEMTDKSKNSFAVICKFIDSVLVTANDQIGF